MRQIVLDTETTGLSHESGHRVIEIGCIELVNRKFTGNHFHTYINPQRDVDEGAFRVHGISNHFLQDKPVFKDVVNEFLNFIKDSELIIHNAPFDVGFLNAELRHLSHTEKLESYCEIIDTLVLARKKHPGQRNTLDALCKRYHVDNSNRQLHGALLDAEILAFVYLSMTGGQSDLFTEKHSNDTSSNIKQENLNELLSSISPVHFATQEEMKIHNDFLAFLAS